MNAYLHRSEDRGHVKAGWLESYRDGSVNLNNSYK